MHRGADSFRSDEQLERFYWPTLPIPVVFASVLSPAWFWVTGDERPHLKKNRFRLCQRREKNEAMRLKV